MSQTEIARRLIEKQRPVTQEEWSLLTSDLMALLNRTREKPVTRAHCRMLITRAVREPGKRGGYHPARGLTKGD